MSLEEAMRDAARRLLLISGRGSSKSSMDAEEIMRQVFEAQALLEARERLKWMSAELVEALRDVADRLAEALRAILGAMPFDSLAKLAEEDMAEPDGMEWQRDREREAVPREQERAAARYKAHRSMMANVKARQHRRRRKYRSGANAGWY